MKTEFLTYPGVYYNPGTGSWISCWLQNGAGIGSLEVSENGQEYIPLSSNYEVRQ